jgi:hypothetical protein
VRGTEGRSGHDAAFDAKPGHALEGKREHGIGPVLKAQIKDAVRGHAQRKRAEGFDEEARQQGAHRLGAVKLEAEQRAAPLESERARHALLGDGVASHQPRAHAAGAGGLLCFECGAQLVARDPALLEQMQAERDAMGPDFGDVCARVELAAYGRFNLGAHAARRAAPAALEDRSAAAAPELEPSRSAAGVGANVKQARAKAGTPRGAAGQAGGIRIERESRGARALFETEIGMGTAAA